MSTCGCLRATWVMLLLGLRALDAQVPAELRGQVRDARTSRAIADARVDVVGRNDAARTDDDGRFTVRGLESRAYTVRVRAFGYLPVQVDANVENGRATTVDIALEPAPALLAQTVVRAARDSAADGVTSFDRGAIERSHRRDVGELLQATPGVVVTQAGGAGAETHVSIRGSAANQVLVLLDGVPINSPITGDVDLSAVPLESVERVTVRVGAQSARYGARALAGVIEIETRRPARDVSTQMRAGAWGERNIAASLGDMQSLRDNRRAGASLTADYRTVRGDFPYDVPRVRGGGTATRANSDVASHIVAGTASLESDAWSATARGSWQMLSRGLAGSIVQPSLTGRQEESTARGGLDLRGRRGVLTWNATGDASHERATFVDPTPPFGTPYDDTVHATAFTSNVSASADHRWLTASAGAEARSLALTSTTLGPDAPHWQRVLGAWTTLRGAWLLEPSATSVDIEAGIRADETSLVDGTTASPRVAVHFTRGHVGWSASYASGYAPPTLADEFFHEGVLVRPNPALRPERTRGELETRVTVHDVSAGILRVGADAAAYRADVGGMILWFPDFRFVWSPANVDVHRSGWETNTNVSIPFVGVDVQGTVNRTDVVYAGPVLGGQVVYRPRTTGAVTVAETRGALRAELVNQYVGERRTVPGSALNALDPYWRTDARLTATVTRTHWTADATIGIENLFDRPAAMLVDYPFPSRAWSVMLRLRRTGPSTLP